jgi:dipeptidyl aminopeptidase/acylaminoacyl peptidase
MRIRTAALVAALSVAPVEDSRAQAGARTAPGYLRPPQVIVDILEAEPAPAVTVSPAHDVIAVMRRRSMPSIDELSRPMLRLAGLRIDPANNGPHRGPSGTSLTLVPILGSARQVETADRSGMRRIVPVNTRVERPVATPPDARIDGATFSPDGTKLVFTNTRPDRIDLYIVDVTTGQARKVDAPLNSVAGECAWLKDSSALLCPFVPDRRGAPPAPPRVPPGPNIQEHAGKAGPVRTYQDMLETAHDEALFEYYFTTQLALVDAATARRTPVGPPVMATASPSPDGQFLLVERVKRPFSRLVMWSDFPQDVEIWNRRGEKVRTIADVPMGDTVPIRGVITGPRAYRWSPLQPATVVWVEALDKGDLRNTVPHRDRIVTLEAPFTGEPAEVAKTEFRFGGLDWTDGGWILLTENDRRTRTTRTWVMSSSWEQARKLWDRKQQDRYSDPGDPVRRAATGTVRQFGDSIYLTGNGASEDGDRPFLDRLNLRTFATERLFRCDPASFESVVALLDDGAAQALTRYENRTTPANYFLRDLRAGTKTAITAFKDPHPEVTKAMADRRFVTYERKDGVGLSGTIYLPVGYKRGQRVPMLVWAYPREFVDADAASQIQGSPHRFTTIGGASHLLLLTQGYAIFDGPSMPIVGPGETANDTYVEQLVASAEAAVEKAVQMGITERGRIAVGGHSYGAFMTANLLAHSDLFAAGIARSGAYNRTLTPFGFQAETRTFWEVPGIYARMSPFWYAQQINEPVLLIHGEADNNSGTFPVQSERLYMALKGHGATVRYVTLPHESHGYLARESVFHTVAETLNWLNKYVKDATSKTTTDSAAVQ